MGPLLIVEILNAFATVLNNPKINGGSNIPLGEASSLLGILASLVSQGAKADEELKLFAGMIKEMANSSRAPTHEEWSALRSRAQAAVEKVAETKTKIQAKKAAPAPKIIKE